jgi:hypothetical protein
MIREEPQRPHGPRGAGQQVASNTGEASSAQSTYPAQNQLAVPTTDKDAPNVITALPSKPGNTRAAEVSERKADEKQEVTKRDK